MELRRVARPFRGIKGGRLAAGGWLPPDEGPAAGAPGEGRAAGSERRAAGEGRAKAWPF